MIRRWLPPFIRSARGATAVEFALVATPLLLLILGTIEFGRLVWTRLALQETAIAGARCMGLRAPSCGTGGTYSSSLTTTYLVDMAQSWAISLTAANLTLNASATCGGQSGFSKVSINYTFQTAVPQMLGALSAGVPLTASACFPNQT